MQADVSLDLCYYRLLILFMSEQCIWRYSLCPYCSGKQASWALLFTSLCSLTISVLVDGEAGSKNIQICTMFYHNKTSISKKKKYWKFSMWRCLFLTPVMSVGKWLDMLMNRCFDASEKKLGKTVQRKSEIIQVWKKKMVLGKMILEAVQGKKKYYWITVL